MHELKQLILNGSMVLDNFTTTIQGLCLVGLTEKKAKKIYEHIKSITMLYTEIEILIKNSSDKEIKKQWDNYKKDNY
jgi:hypothetical protein